MTRNSPGETSTESRRQEILAAQVRLLSANAGVAVAVTLVSATILSRLQWRVIPNHIVAGWWSYMVLVSMLRYAVARHYRRNSGQQLAADKWRTVFAVGSGLAGLGWGAAGILLYPETQLINQIFLIFVLGGMMLGAASLLAPRPEAFLAFLIPSGFAPAFRLLATGDETHLAMGLLAAIFTVATVITTWRIHAMVDSSLMLQFNNRDLVEDLRAANDRTEALNQVLENRVRERTAELHRSNEQLRAEIAQREQAEEELLRVRKLESLGVLAGGIAHDFNNILTIIQGNIQVAKARLGTGQRVEENLDETIRACRQAAFLSSQLLTFAKGGSPVRRLVSVAKLVTEAVHLIRAGAPVSVHVDVAKDLWFAEVDPGQISQMLHNILLNARQAMPEGGIIEVRAENAAAPTDPDREPVIRISIRDYGRGIPADVLPRIFDPYFTTKPGGSGLGLATAHAIVSKHGGHISAASKPGEGTTFTIDLPASRETPARQASSTAGLKSGTGRVLIMDDEPALRQMLDTILTELGYVVSTAGDGAEVIALCEEARAAEKDFDVILLDLTVQGGMGGMETAAKLKELDVPSKLIVSSGYSDAPVMSDFARYGFDAVLPKPWTLEALSDVLGRVLAGNPDRSPI